MANWGPGSALVSVRGFLQPSVSLYSPGHLFLGQLSVPTASFLGLWEPPRLALTTSVFADCLPRVSSNMYFKSWPSPLPVMPPNDCGRRVESKVWVVGSSLGPRSQWPIHSGVSPSCSLHRLSSGYACYKAVISCPYHCVAWAHVGMTFSSCFGGPRLTSAGCAAGFLETPMLGSMRPGLSFPPCHQLVGNFEKVTSSLSL